MVDGLPYTIKSEARLITDAQGENISCALDDGEGMTVVTWPSATTRWERRMPLPENGVIYVDRNGDCTLQAPRQINYGVNGEHKCAILTVRGTYPKSMTLGSEDDILIDDDLVARTTCTNDDLRYRSPSYFLDPLQAAWRVVRANQQVPAAR